MKNTLKKIVKTSLILFLTISIISCNKNKDDIKEEPLGHLKATIKDDSGKVYFFTDKKYYRYDIKNEKLEKEAEISGNWKGLPNSFDAALLNPPNKKGYFFKEEKYFKYDFKEGVIYEGTIGVDGWRGVPSNVDAVFAYGNEYIFFFKEDKYYRYNHNIGNVDIVGSISEWKGLPNNLDAVLVYDNEYYFFKENTYYRYNQKAGVDEIGTVGVDGWKGLKFSE